MMIVLDSILVNRFLPVFRDGPGLFKIPMFDMESFGVTSLGSPGLYVKYRVLPFVGLLFRVCSIVYLLR